MSEYTPKELVTAAECQENFYFFCRYMFKKQKGLTWLRNSHHGLICQKLMEVYEGKVNRLIINIPPRYSKTQLCSIYFPAWCLGKNPDCEFILASYSATLASNNSWQTKTLVESDYYNKMFPMFKLQDDQKRKDDWRTKDGGCLYSTGFEGTVTGYGAGKLREGFGGALIIDDPLKADEANSTVKRQKVIDQFHNTFYSRLNSRETPIIIIMQRLHEDDLTGHLLDDGSGEKWEHLNLPAIINDEPLWKEKHTLDELKKMENSNPYVFASQYMQNPSPLGGGIFKDTWWKYYDILPQIDYSIIVCDTAMKTKEQHDYSVFGCFAIGVDGNVYVTDILRGKWEAPELEVNFKAFWNKHNVENNKLRYAAIEDKASGIGLIQKIKREYKIPVKPVKRDSSDKLTRAMNIVEYVASGYVYLKSDASWLSDFLTEVGLFNNAKHDDQVDVLTDALDLLFSPKKEYKIRVV